LGRARRSITGLMGGGSRWYRGNLMDDAARYLAFREKRGAAPGKCQLTCALAANAKKRQSKTIFFLLSFQFCLDFAAFETQKRHQDLFAWLFSRVTKIFKKLCNFVLLLKSDCMDSTKKSISISRRHSGSFFLFSLLSAKFILFYNL
jgi:hypothetical protein